MTTCKNIAYETTGIHRSITNGSDSQTTMVWCCLQCMLITAYKVALSL